MLTKKIMMTIKQTTNKQKKNKKNLMIAKLTSQKIVWDKKRLIVCKIYQNASSNRSEKINKKLRKKKIEKISDRNKEKRATARNEFMFHIIFK